jgi:hypothetical protein
MGAIMGVIMGDCAWRDDEPHRRHAGAAKSADAAGFLAARAGKRESGPMATGLSFAKRGRISGGMDRHPARLLFATALLVAMLAAPAPSATAETIFPTASRIGLAPPPGMHASKSFPGFEDRDNNAFIRLIALPGKAFAELEKTMSSDVLKKQGLAIEKRESFPMPSGKGLLIIAQQSTGNARIRKWLLLAPLGDVTALASVEIPLSVVARYPAPAIRAALATLAARPEVPVDEQLALVPFKLGELSGFRLVRVLPGVALQLTDGPKDALEATEQPHLVISVAPGGPQQAGDREQFARLALAGLPAFKELRLVSSESMRVGGMAGHETRAEGKDPKTGVDIAIVQWLRFGNGAYMRIVGFAPKESWTQAFMRFRAVRDGLEPR